ncbi:Aspartic protease 6 [Aphelenchoides besseyi]|nr:Aspartic protease 6 [Aphelenchoides besseyi]
MLAAGLLIASALVTFVEAGSWSLALRAAQQNDLKNNALGPLSDVYGREITYDRRYYQGRYNEVCKSTINGYNPGESKTSKAANLPSLFSISYGDGSITIRGHFYNDLFTFDGNRHFKNPIKIGAAEELVNIDKGILGLPSSEPLKADGVSIMHEAWRQKILDDPIFTLYLRHCPPSEDCETHGFVTFGAEDKVNCGDIEGHVDVDSGNLYWKFTVERFQMGDVDILTPYKTIIDSGAPLIYVPKPIFDDILKQFNAIEKPGYHYLVKCDVDVHITLTINGRDYVIPSKYMLRNLHNNYCSLLLHSSENYFNGWLLGIPFYKAYCLIHDFKKPKVSFAKVQEQL